MPGEIEEILVLSKRASVKTMSADGIVFQGPGYLFDIHIAAASDVSDCIVYLGTSINGTKLTELYTIANTSFHHPYWPPVYCAVGLYLDIGTRLRSVSFHYMEIKE